ncbi:MAG: endolytic transglycosylase MltG [Eubacterium sp.]|nr:endolytic transglycosylase MltG [Eubacterium sp.]
MDGYVNDSQNNKDVYFANEDARDAGAAKKGKDKTSGKKKKKKRGSGIGATYLFFLFVIAASMVISVYAIFCMNDILAITKTTSSVTVSFTQQVQDSDEAIDVLADNGLIKCKHFCKLFVKLRDEVIHSSHLGGPYEAGVYYLNGKMGLEGMLMTMKGEQVTGETVTLMFPEGATVPDIIDKLSDNDVCDKTALLSVIETTDFNNYKLTKNLQAKESVPYRLEGFLFPETYEFYINESAASVVKRFLSQGDKIYTDEYAARAKELGYSDYDIIIIASIIQKEAANNEQMAEISAIIHNRLDDTVNFPTLGCQSTSDYITNKVAPALSSTSAHTADYYMTYYNTNNSSTVVGLPAGPICNPGQAAIEAALWPADSDDYFFFHDTNGTMYTAKTYSEFKELVQKYAPYLEY